MKDYPSPHSYFVGVFVWGVGEWKLISNANIIKQFSIEIPWYIFGLYIMFVTRRL